MAACVTAYPFSKCFSVSPPLRRWEVIPRLLAALVKAIFSAQILQACQILSLYLCRMDKAAPLLSCMTEHTGGVLHACRSEAAR